MGNVYVADISNNAINKITPNGVVTTLAGLAGGYGTADGTGSDARFGEGFGGPYSGPKGVAVDSVGNVYVTVYGDGVNTIRKVTPAGVVTTLAGLGGPWQHGYGPFDSYGCSDGTGSDARFFRPVGVAVDSAGNLYVADSMNNTVRKGSPALLIVASGQEFGLDAAHAGLKFAGPMGKSVVVEGSTDLVSGIISGDRAHGIARLHPDGAVDTSFNADPSLRKALAVQSDGRIIALGALDWVVRLLPDGSPDSSFSSPKMELSETGANDIIMATIVQADGKVIVAEQSSLPPKSPPNSCGSSQTARAIRNFVLRPAKAHRDRSFLPR